MDGAGPVKWAEQVQLTPVRRLVNATVFQRTRQSIDFLTHLQGDFGSEAPRIVTHAGEPQFRNDYYYYAYHAYLGVDCTYRYGYGELNKRTEAVPVRSALYWDRTGILYDDLSNDPYQQARITVDATVLELGKSRKHHGA